MQPEPPSFPTDQTAEANSAVDSVSPLWRYLQEHDLDAEIIRADRDTSTVQEAAAALHVQPGQIVKSLLFRGKDGDTVLVVVPGDRKVSRRKLATITGSRKPQLAPADVVLQLTGFPAGGTPPIAHLTRLPVIVDGSVLSRAVVFGGGGRSDLLIRIRPADIVRLTNARVADICVGEQSRFAEAPQ